MFSVGFLTGQEVDWLPHVTRLLRAELPKIEFKVTSMYSPDLATALQEGEIDLGFLRVEPKPDVTYKVIAKEQGVDLTPSHRIENFATGLSLVASIRGVALLPAYVEPLLPWSVVSRPLAGEPPTIDLAVGYRSENPSPALKVFLAGLDQLIAAGPAGTRRAR